MENEIFERKSIKEKYENGRDFIFIFGNHSYNTNMFGRFPSTKVPRWISKIIIWTFVNIVVKNFYKRTHKVIFNL